MSFPGDSVAGTASNFSGIDCPRLWNSTGGMNTIPPKDHDTICCSVWERIHFFMFHNTFIQIISSLAGWGKPQHVPAQTEMKVKWDEAEGGTLTSRRSLPAGGASSLQTIDLGTALLQRGTGSVWSEVLEACQSWWKTTAELIYLHARPNPPTQRWHHLITKSPSPLSPPSSSPPFPSPSTALIKKSIFL